jgi:putative copper export protein
MALVSSFIANVFGGVAFFTLWLAACCPVSQSRIRALSCNFFIACLFQGFTLLIFQSNICQKGFFAVYFPGADLSAVKSVSCSLDTGSNLAVSATVFYFLCMFVVQKALVPKPIRVGGSWDDDLGDVETSVEK